MLTRTVPRRLCVIHNLERDPVDLESVSDRPWREFESGLPEPDPLFSDSRIVSHTFHGWALLFMWIALVVGIGLSIKVVGEGVFHTYAARIHS